MVRICYFKFLRYWSVKDIIILEIIFSNQLHENKITDRIKFIFISSYMDSIINAVSINHVTDDNSIIITSFLRGIFT